MQSMLSPKAQAAADIAGLAWVLFSSGVAILLFVLAATVYALWTGLERRAWLGSERFVLAAGVAFPVVALTVLLLYVYTVAHRLETDRKPALRIALIAEQWWWRVLYLDAEGRPEFETANEIRIPVGKPIELALGSADVIHSFWVPSLAGKVDMIPGRVNRMIVSAAAAGTYRGQCAEFCGGPHALMALHVIAQAEAEFEAWRERERGPAASGHALFSARCGACHAVRGTEAAGTRGPDLTHVASRRFIAAGTLPNTQAGMAAWLADSQHAKPGNLMPAMRLTSSELETLATYIATLK